MRKDNESSLSQISEQVKFDMESKRDLAFHKYVCGALRNPILFLVSIEHSDANSVQPRTAFSWQRMLKRVVV